MKGLIFQNAYFDAPEYLSQGARIREELERLGVEVEIKRGALLTVDGDGIKCGLNGYDFCVYLDKDKYVLRALEKCGVRTFNRREAIELCDDKMLTLLALSGKGVKTPATVPAPLCYDPNAAVDEKQAIAIEKALGYPLVVKTAYGSRGTGVFLVGDRTELIKKTEELKLQPHLYQRFIGESCGKDLRVIVLGGKVLGGMKRRSKGDFRSNAALGGSAEVYPVSAETAKLCVDCAEILGLDYCGIDLLFAEGGDMLVCEVNSNAFFSAFERATGVNVAKAYAEYIVRQISPPEKGRQKPAYR